MSDVYEYEQIPNGDWVTIKNGKVVSMIVWETVRIKGDDVPDAEAVP